jgi:thioesterase domain-containing protein/acyl carrier protein
VDRQALPPPGEHDIERAHRYTPPRNSTESQLVDIWQQVLDVQPIGVQDNFFDLGGHSLLAVRLFSLIEKEMGIKLPLMTLFDAPTIENQSKSLLSKREETDPAWIVDVQTSGSKPPFFCVSPSVIDVITYRELSRNMGEDQPFFALYSESMGLWREGIEQLEIIAKQFIEKIREIDQQGPYFIGGYSAGGIVALEIATQLKKQDFNVGLVVLFDTFGPNYPRLLPGITPRIFNALRVVRRIQSYWWKFRLLDWKGKLQQLRFPKVHTWVRDRYGEVRAPVRPTTEKGAYFITPARRKYKPGNYDGEVLLVRAEKGFLGIRRDPMMGWGEVFSSDLEVCMVPGDHEAMLFGPRSKYVAERLTSYLASSIRKLQD